MRGGARGRGADARAGLTLAELLVAAALLAVLLSATVALTVRVEREVRGTAARQGARQQLAHGAAVLRAELAGVDGAPPTDGGDLLAIGDSVLELRAGVGGGVACTVTGGTTVELPPSTGAEPVLAWWASPPRAGDTALLLDEGASEAPDDDRWVERPVVESGSGTSYCRTGAFGALAAGAPAAARTRLVLAGPALPSSVRSGAPVRVVRRRRYAPYRGGDGLWYLGQREWDLGGPAAVQPVAGPLAAPAGGVAGMSVVAIDAAGGAVIGAPPTARVAAVTVVLRAVARDGARAWPESVGVRVRLAGGG